MEAYKDRGYGDGRSSKDFEDIVFLLEHRTAIWQELEKVDLKLSKYLKTEFRNLMAKPLFEEWVDGHVERQSLPATSYILKALREFIK